jgi:hypothetical protein
MYKKLTQLGLVDYQDMDYSLLKRTGIRISFKKTETSNFFKNIGVEELY